MTAIEFTSEYEDMLSAQNAKLKEQEKVIFNLVQQKQAMLKADADAANLEGLRAAQAEYQATQGGADPRVKADEETNKQIIEQRKMLQLEFNVSPRILHRKGCQSDRYRWLCILLLFPPILNLLQLVSFSSSEIIDSCRGIGAFALRPPYLWHLF